MDYSPEDPRRGEITIPGTVRIDYKDGTRLRVTAGAKILPKNQQDIIPEEGIEAKNMKNHHIVWVVREEVKAIIFEPAEKQATLPQ